MNKTVPVRLGLMPPLSGIVKLYGNEITTAARIACAEVNSSGGVLGRPLELVIEDDGSLPETAIPAANKLIDDHGCIAIIGNLLSNSRIAVANLVAEPRQVPYLNFSFYEGSISSRYFFHFAALPNQQIDRMIPYMATNYGPKMFFAGNNYEWPRGSIDAAKRVLLANQGEIVGEEYFQIGTDNFDNLLDRLAKSGADVFIPYAAGNDQLNLLNQFYKKGLKERMAVAMGHYDEALVANLLPEVRDGLYSSNTYFMNVDTPENRNYMHKLQAYPGTSGVWPNGNGILTNFGEGTYVCVKAFAQAVNEAASLDREKIIDALENVKINGPQGLVAMDPETHHASVNGYLARCETDGTFTILEEYGLIEPKIPDRYKQKDKQHHVGGNKSTGKLKAVDINIDASKQILKKVDIVILATDDQGNILEANENAARSFGYSLDELLGMSIHQLVPPHLREAHRKHVAQFISNQEQQRFMGQRGEIVGYRKDGTFFPAEASISKLTTPSGPMLIATLKDISEEKKTREQLLWQATHDPLTLLPNRGLVQERLEKALQRSKQSGKRIGVLFIDLDGFKLINDNYGHDVGDKLLAAISNRIIDIVRPGDTVGRFVGDEFVVLCDQLERNSFVEKMATHLVSAFKQPFYISEMEIFVSVSVGVATGDGVTDTAQTLLSKSDAAMTNIKQHGRNAWGHFTNDIGENTRTNLRIANGLRRSLDNNEMFLMYQPIMDITANRIIGAEALIRWIYEEQLMSPAIFIPIAESNGSIHQIGKWVFEQACQTLASWQSYCGTEEPPYMSINLSARQLENTSFLDVVSQTIDKFQINTNRLVLEVTESTFMSDIETPLKMLEQLNQMGIQIAIDDFGTGYSSLGQLKQLPINILKVDRCFIDEIDCKPNDYAITSAVIKMAQALGHKVVAEGVETKSQLAVLKELDCQMAQGYYYYRPMTQMEFEGKLKQQLSKQSLRSSWKSNTTKKVS